MMISTKSLLQHLGAGFSCSELTSAFGVSAYKLKRIVPTLEKCGLAWFSEDMNDNATLELASPRDEVSWAAIADFWHAAGIDLARFVISLQSVILTDSSEYLRQCVAKLLERNFLVSAGGHKFSALRKQSTLQWRHSDPMTAR